MPSGGHHSPTAFIFLVNSHSKKSLFLFTMGLTGHTHRLETNPTKFTTFIFHFLFSHFGAQKKGTVNNKPMLPPQRKAIRCGCSELPLCCFVLFIIVLINLINLIY